ncbi:MAG TPA: hypothetical protein VK133_04235 [Amoebophilaceae bacterium]|jgi:hypothetical protein|nr:hypothetical protein [Amoebophilaceae bacterium]
MNFKFKNQYKKTFTNSEIDAQRLKTDDLWKTNAVAHRNHALAEVLCRSIQISCSESGSLCWGMTRC